jgi:hypothetical protein
MADPNQASLPQMWCLKTKPRPLAELQNDDALLPPPPQPASTSATAHVNPVNVELRFPMGDPRLRDRTAAVSSF